PPSLPTPKARALGATLAAKVGVPVDDIASRGAWSSHPCLNAFTASPQHPLISQVLLWMTPK
ncbi:hypothetical protein DM01DRAFT_1392413, partial [Hesseltinella vesiculosa]